MSFTSLERLSNLRVIQDTQFRKKELLVMALVMFTVALSRGSY